MLKVGITGGIGSGKSVVAKVFSLLGIPVLNADDVARFLMDQDATLQSGLINAFGENVIQNGRINRPFLASLVFRDEAKLQLLNAIVHPATIRYGRKWMKEQQSDYAIKEAALFFESGSAGEMDLMVGVSAPLHLRLKRAMKRDNVSKEEISNRMRSQMDEEEKMARCDFIIYNDDCRSVIQQVLDTHAAILEVIRGD